jgi:hypothetical protein
MGSRLDEQSPPQGKLRDGALISTRVHWLIVALSTDEFKTSPKHNTQQGGGELSDAAS